MVAQTILELPAMNSRSLSTLAIVGFLLVGGACMGFRYRSLQQVKTAREDSLWRLTYDVRFEAITDPTQEPAQVDTVVRLAQPFDTSHCEVLSRNWSSINPELQFSDRTLSATRTRELVVTTSQPNQNPYNVLATFELRLSPRTDTSRELSLESLSADARALFLRNETDLPVTSAQVKSSVDSLPADAVTPAERVQAIFDYCIHIESPPGESLDSVAEALRTKKGSALARARAMVAMCRAIKMPARPVAGFEIKQQSNARPRVWVEVFQGQRWVPYDPEFGYTHSLPMQYVPARRGGDAIVGAVETSNLVNSYSIVCLPGDERLLREDVQHPIQILYLKRLPVPMHTVMKILLLLPFAALITAILRNVVGLQTFGTFSPALLAMSFIYADWKTGLAILVIVVTVGLLGRTFLERLRLLTVPRLSIILTIVILCVVFSVSALNFLLPKISADAVLLPMVILTMLIERFHVSVEEDGLVFTLKLAIGTLVAAVLCFAVLGWEDVGDWVLTFPEAHFFTIAAFIVLGRYAGYRLTELWRFRDLVDSSETVR